MISNKILTLLKYGVFFISVIIISYILLIHIGQFIVTNTDGFDPRIFTKTYLQVLTALALISASTGALITRVQGDTSKVTFGALTTKEKIITILTACFLSVFFIGDATLASPWSKVYFIGFTLLFLFLIPYLVNFFATFNVHHEQFRISGGKKEVAAIAFSTLVFIFGIAVIVNIVTRYMSGQIADDVDQKSKLYITSIEPQKTTHAETVTLQGYNFSWRVDHQDTYKLMSTQGEIPPHEWTNERITFIVPLSLKEGKNDIWIQRPKENTDPTLIESNKVQLEVIDRFDFFPVEDDNKLERGIKKVKRYIFNNWKFLNFIF